MVPLAQTAGEAGQQKVKYFGTILPPKCEYHGCYLSDDGAHFYCTDFTCNKHKYRRTKHNRYSRHEHLDRVKAQERAAQVEADQDVTQRGFWPIIYFKCPKCAGRDIQMRVMRNRYECAGCAYTWR